MSVYADRYPASYLEAVLLLRSLSAFCPFVQKVIIMRNQLILVAILLCLLSAQLPAQGLTTTATKVDWEEINFAFDRAILTDGYPSLLRLAELLKKNSDYTVKLEGHADGLGSDQYNKILSEKRARTVRDFLLKYGTSAGQISIVARGKGSPKASNDTTEGRWMNRRVVVTLADADGRVISDGSVGDAIHSLDELARKQDELAKQQEDCCNKILRKLDDVLDLLKGLKAENEGLKQDVADLKKGQDGLRDAMGKRGDAGPSGDQRAAAGAPGTPETSGMPGQGAGPADSRSGGEAGRFSSLKQYATVNFNAGPDTQNGNVAFSGKGRVFVPFASRYALQAEGEFFHQFGREEGQFDVGLVNRFGNIQAGLFSSFKVVKFDEFQRTGTLGQAALTLDYVFKKGRVGFFGTKKFMDGAIVNEALIQRHVLEQTFLQVVDQAGVSAAVAAWGDSWIEGNVGAMFRSGGGNRPGGSVRYIHPITPMVAFTMEAGMNQTLVSSNNTGRVVVGIEIGKWLSPNKYEMEGDGPVPVDIPRVRYEVLKRRIRSGNDAPVADGGPDLIGVEAGPITLDASASFDPDDDEITFVWDQIGGDPISLAGSDTAQASFTAEEGKVYQFRLTVRDTRGAADTDRVTVSTLDRQIKITRFTASPETVQSGEPVTIVWEVQNATEVEISGVGKVDATSGTSTVTLSETTTFTLIARNPKRDVSQSVVVTVLTPQPRIRQFTATPRRVAKGETATLVWETEDADRVSITGIGSVAPNGTATVTVNEATTYVLTAANDHGEVSTSVAVTVTEPRVEAPQIIRFVATPAQLAGAGTTTLVWEVRNSDDVTITEIGDVGASGSSTVSVSETKTFTLTARNEAGEINATAVVTVVDGSPAKILEFNAMPAVVKEPGDPSVLSWSTEGATQVSIVGIGDVAASGSVTVNPVVRTTYVLIAYGVNSEVSSEVTVTIENANQAPMAIINNNRVVYARNNGLATVTLDGTRSMDPEGGTITYQWRSIGAGNAEISNPTSATPTVRFVDGTGSYEFELEVTDDKGLRGFARHQIQVADL